MNAPSPALLGLVLGIAGLGIMTGCGKSAKKPAAKAASAQDAEFLGLLREIDRSRDPRRAQHTIAMVLREEHFVAPLLKALADPTHRHLAAAIRCAGTAPTDPPTDAETTMADDESTMPEPATVATAWTQAESPASARIEPLLLGHLQHGEPTCRAAALAALAARGQVPAAASELLADAEASVRAAAVTACLRLDSPPWPELAAALLSLAADQIELMPLDATAADQLGVEVSARIDWQDLTTLPQRLPLMARLSLPASAIDGLLATLAREDEPLATAVLTFLAQRGSPLDDAQPVLRVALAPDQPGGLRHLAMHCLESCAAQVVAELQQAMPDLDGSQRIAAARVMIRGGSPAGIDVLCDVAQGGEDCAQQAVLLLARLAGASANTPVEDLRSRIAARDLRQLRLP